MSVISLKKQDPVQLDDLIPINDYPVIKSDISFDDGINILVSRLGLTVSRVRALSRDRYPCKPAVVENNKPCHLNLRNFIQFDIIFTDILHTSYEELKHIGVGRRWLTCHIFRGIISGICDSLDNSGVSGDFPPRSWFDDSKSAMIENVQNEALKILKHECKKQYDSVRVRLSRISTCMLKSLSDSVSEIRKRVRKAETCRRGSGIVEFDLIFRSFLKKFKKVVNYNLINSRLASRRKDYKLRSRLFHTFMHFKNTRIRLEKKLERVKRQKTWKILRMKITDLKRVMDPKIPYWYRRPSDIDWNEGERSDRRKVRFHASVYLKHRHGIDTVPGITAPIDPKEWNNVKTDWKLDEIRKKKVYRV